VHVTNILRKLDVTDRMQAAALAERTRLLNSLQPQIPLGKRAACVSRCGQG